MYAKLLKENASGLSLLVIENDHASREAVGKSLSPFFKRITFSTHEEEACKEYRSKKYDLILIDIDTFDGEICRFIDKIHRYDLFQALAVCSSRTDDAELMLKLLNSQIACFIPKPSESSSLYQILSKVCSKVHDRAVLMHYIETLEDQHEKAISVSCKEKCPMKAELKLTESVSVQTASVAEEEDDFFFFPDTSSVAVSSSEDVSMYQDYFRFLDGDDHEELNDLISDIDSALLNAFNGNGDEAEIGRLGSTLMKYGNVLLHYQFFSDMGTAILEFGKSISDYAHEVAERSGDLSMLISGFCSGLQTFLNEVWEVECANPKFFNDSIINDAQTIISMIVPSESVGEEDALFFF